MTESRPDVLEILELEKEYHADQIRRINVAMAALRGKAVVEETTQQGQPTQKTTKPVQWTAEIKEIFKVDDMFTIEQVREKLIEKGIIDANHEREKNSIYSTFSRLKKSGYLEQPEYGKYRRKQPKLKGFSGFDEHSQ